MQKKESNLVELWGFRMLTDPIAVLKVESVLGSRLGSFGCESLFFINIPSETLLFLFDRITCFSVLS